MYLRHIPHKLLPSFGRQQKLVSTSQHSWNLAVMSPLSPSHAYHHGILLVLLTACIVLAVTCCASMYYTFFPQMP